MPKHNFSNASQLYYGHINYAPLLGMNKRPGVELTPLTKMDLGAPIVADPNGVVVSQDLTALGVFSISVTAAAAILAGALAGIFDVPRNVVAAWTGAAVLTVTGTDMYGENLTESSASGTSFTGTKAFKTITDVSVDADVTALTVGTGVVLGLPYNVAGGFDIVSFYADTTMELAASTFVPGDATVASAVTGDTRGTVTPNTAPDGTVRYRIWAHVADAATKQGMVGVPQA